MVFKYMKIHLLARWTYRLSLGTALATAFLAIFLWFARLGGFLSVIEEPYLPSSQDDQIYALLAADTITAQIGMTVGMVLFASAMFAMALLVKGYCEKDYFSLASLARLRRTAAALLAYAVWQVLEPYFLFYAGGAREEAVFLISLDSFFTLALSVFLFLITKILEIARAAVSENEEFL